MNIETEIARKKLIKAEIRFRNKQYDDAIRMFREICNSSRLVDQEIKKAAMLNMGASYRAKSKHLQALRIYDEYIDLYNANLPVLYNKANTYDALGEFKLAIQTYLDALNFDQNNKLVLENLAQCYIREGNISDSKIIYQNLSTQYSNNAEINHGLSELLLREKNYRAGWKLYFWRLFRSTENDPIFFKMFPTPDVYNNTIENFNNNDYVIIDEQGIGDTIMFSSVLPDLVRKYGKFDLFVNSRLVSLFGNSFKNLNFEERDSILDKIGNRKVLLIGDLMRIFRSSIDSFDGNGFLIAPNNQENFFNGRINNQRKKMIIGISWRGGTEHNRMAHRSLDLQYFVTKLFSGLDVKLVSIQHNINKEEIRNYGMDITFFENDDIHDIGSLSELHNCLDLIVTVQNTNVHLAGSLGKKCFALLPFSPEWRYGNEGSSMPWYNSVELFRQKVNGDWSGLLAEVRSRILIEIEEFYKRRI